MAENASSQDVVRSRITSTLPVNIPIAFSPFVPKCFSCGDLENFLCQVVVLALDPNNSMRRLQTYPLK
jgi:hypothetical protein